MGAHIRLVSSDNEPFLCVDGAEESSCVPCSLVRHLERETIAEEAVLVWLWRDNLDGKAATIRMAILAVAAR